MENEIMNNDVIETTEDIAMDNSGKGLLVAAGVGLALVVGGFIYKKVIKPAIAKAKAKKEDQAIDAEFEEVDCDDECDSEEESE